MSQQLLFKLIMLALGFAGVVGIFILLLSPAMVLLYAVLMALIFTILWFASVDFQQAISTNIGGLVHRIRTKVKLATKSGTEEYNNKFQVEYQLVCTVHGRTTTAPIVCENFVIGRASTCNMVIARDATVSREHCRIVYRKYSHTYYLEDMRSGSGTYLGTRRLEPYTQEKLLEGAEISISDRVYRFVKIGT